MASVWWYVAVTTLSIPNTTCCFTLSSSSLFLVFRNKWAYMFNSDSEVVTLVASIMPLLAGFQLFDGPSAVASGILRARAMQGAGALLSLG